MCCVAAGLGANSMAPTPRMRPDNVADQTRHRIVVPFAGHIGRVCVHERMCQRRPHSRHVTSRDRGRTGTIRTPLLVRQTTDAASGASREDRDSGRPKGGALGPHSALSVKVSVRLPLAGRTRLLERSRDAAIACLLAGGRSPARRGAETIPAAGACASLLEGGRDATVARLLQ
jgi:hypothetical protein